MIWYIFGALLVAFIAFVYWRYTSVARGAMLRDERIFPLIEPIAEALAAGERPSATEVETLAGDPAARGMLYQTLKHYESLDLFPSVFRTELSQAEASLTYWMMHPNELQDAPADMKLVETVVRTIDTVPCRFHVFKYSMPEGHWAGTEWILGLSGPFFDSDPPFSGVASAFSRCGDKHGEKTPMN